MLRERLPHGGEPLGLAGGDREEQRIAIGEVLEDRALGHPGPGGDGRGGRLDVAVLEKPDERVDHGGAGPLGASSSSVKFLHRHCKIV